MEGGRCETKNAGKMYKFINRGTRPESLREERRGKER